MSKPTKSKATNRKVSIRVQQPTQPTIGLPKQLQIELWRHKEQREQAKANKAKVEAAIASTTYDSAKLQSLISEFHNLPGVLKPRRSSFSPDVLESMALDMLCDAFRHGAFSDAKWYVHKLTLIQYPHFGTWATIVANKSGNTAERWNSPDAFIVRGCPIVADAIANNSPIDRKTMPDITAARDDGEQEEFPPGQFYDRTNRKTYDFGKSVLLCALWTCLYTARKKLSYNDLLNTVWSGRSVGNDAIRSAISGLRQFWKANKRNDLAARIHTEAGLVFLTNNSHKETTAKWR